MLGTSKLQQRGNHRFGFNVTRRLVLTTFGDIDVNDPFFDSLKAGYDGFEDWFASKSGHEVFAVRDGDETLSGMLYLKEESGEIVDVEPPLPAAKWLKVGTMKIVGRGTKLGERVLKKILDSAIHLDCDGVYVTVFEVHGSLIDLFKRYGFVEHGRKITQRGEELVLKRDLQQIWHNSLLDYPFFKVKGRRAWILAIYPDYHTAIFPDSILNNEPEEIVKDVSHTNTIQKVYIGGVSLTRMTEGDLVIFYRTTDKQAPAFYRSVATSVCVIQETKSRADFDSETEFLEYSLQHSVFSEAELRAKYRNDNRLYVAKVTYNAAFNRRVTRGRLLEEALITEHPRWDLREITLRQFRHILEMGQVNARLAID